MKTYNRILKCLSMSEACPLCERIVGKLYHSCEFCHVRYCEDCIHPKKHYCPKFKKGLNKIELQTKTSPVIDSKVVCDDFAKKYTENEEEISFLTLSNIKKRVAEGNGILDMYICPLCVNVRDVDRYACIHCRNDRNLKCEWYGNHFCEICIKPERHKCTKYENEMRKLSYVEPTIKSKVIGEVIKVKEVIKVENKISLWKRFLLILGFSK